VNRRRIAAFVDAVVADRRPRRFRAGAEDVQTLRAAVALRGARHPEGTPAESFVAALHHDLAQQLAGSEGRRRRTPLPTRARLFLGAAAVAALMGGTAATTTAVDHVLVAAKSRPASPSAVLRVGTFESATGHKLGQIVAYRGSPSWVFMSIQDPSVRGTLSCELKASDGRTVAMGSFVTRDGSGEWARTVALDVGRFRNAVLVNLAGATVATAHFSAA